jgi:dipeptidyl aminopeptidase/acylaminoacyl peptidase
MLDRPDHAVWIGDGLAVYARKAPRDGGSAKFSSYYARDPNVPLERADWYLLRNGVEPANLTRDFMAVSPIPPPTNADTLTVLADGNAWQIDSDGRARRLTNAGSNPLSYSALDSLWWLDPYPTMMTESAKLVSLSASKTNLTIVSSDGCARKPYVEIAVPYANAKPIAASCRGKFGVFRIDGNSGSKITFADSRGRTITLKTFNTFMRKVDWPTWRVLKYKSTNGRELSGCVLLPPNYLPGKRYSTVVAVYPGYSPRCKDGEANIDLFPNGYSQDLLASAGYIIFHPDLPISVIRTPAGPLVGLNEAVVSGLDAVVAAGYADGDDCQLIGESQGGFTALWLATQTTRFRSVVAINSWADLWSFYFDNGYWLNFYAREFQFARNASRFEAGPNTAFGLGVTPWQDQAIYLRNNPIALAPNIAEPILLVQGDLDSLASVNQFGEMFSALYRLHKQATFLRYWGEGHGMSSPANIRDLSERLQAWFESHRKHGSSNR